MELAATAVEGPVFTTPRSALRVTGVETVELSLFVVGSLGCWLDRLPVLPIEVAVEDDLIWARIRNVLPAPAESEPTAVEPDQELAPAAAGSQAGRLL